MSVFDTDLIQKDLPLKDILHNKILERVEKVSQYINEKSRKGETIFPVATDHKPYGVCDKMTWDNRYTAFIDYISVSLEYFKEEINKKPLIHDGKNVYILSTRVFSDWSKFASIQENNIKFNVVMDVNTISRHGIKKETETYRYIHGYNISLEPPTFPSDRLHYSLRRFNFDLY